MSAILLKEHARLPSLLKNSDSEAPDRTQARGRPGYLFTAVLVRRLRG